MAQIAEAQRMRAGCRRSEGPIRRTSAMCAMSLKLFSEVPRCQKYYTCNKSLIVSLCVSIICIVLLYVLYTLL